MEILRNAWIFFTSQILGMKWINDLSGLLVSKVFRLNLDTRLGGGLQFFIYDTIKIFILLSVLIFIISYIQSFFPPEKTKRILSKFKGIKGNIMGALLGTITPFCSCSSIPIFMGFTSAKIPIGITFSFLISSPFVDLASFLLLFSFFGLKVAIIYVVVGVLLAVIGGTIIEKLKMERYIDGYEEMISQEDSSEEETEKDSQEETLTKKERLIYAKEQVLNIVKKVWLFILIGVGIGALIHNFIPQEFIEKILGSNNPFSVIIATVVGIPMYADIFGTIPIAEALFLKGVGIGTILSFMMAVTALSAPSMIMLSNILKPKLLITFIGIVSVGLMVIGYLFNVVAPLII